MSRGGGDFFVEGMKGFLLLVIFGAIFGALKFILPFIALSALIWFIVKEINDHFKK